MNTLLHQSYTHLSIKKLFGHFFCISSFPFTLLQNIHCQKLCPQRFCLQISSQSQCNSFKYTAMTTKTGLGDQPLNAIEWKTGFEMVHPQMGKATSAMPFIFSHIPPSFFQLWSNFEGSTTESWTRENAWGWDGTRAHKKHQDTMWNNCKHLPLLF